MRHHPALVRALARPVSADVMHGRRPIPHARASITSTGRIFWDGDPEKPRAASLFLPGPTDPQGTTTDDTLESVPTQ